MTKSLLRVLFLAVCVAAQAQTKPRPGAPEARMAWLDNGVVKLGCDLGFGGAITWFSLSQGPNLVNNFDAGRQIQMSFYSGPAPFLAGGQEPAEHWKHLGWNPIQAGDDFGNGSRVLHHEIDAGKHQLHLRCVPLQWPLNKVEGDCEFSQWISLHGATAHVRCRLENRRADATQYSGRHQELPAVYTIGRFHRLLTYSGDAPFTDAPLSQIAGPPPGKSPWHHWSGTEGWAALLDDAGWGLGVWHPGTTRFIGGFAGEPGVGGTFDTHTGYLAPLRTEILDAAIVYDYEFDLILGTEAEIRAHVYRRAGPPKLPVWDFAQSREGWHYAGLTDAGWPVKGSLRIEGAKPGAHLLSPETFWRAENAPRLRLRARCHGSDGQLHLFWRRLGETRADPKSRVTVQLRTDGEPDDLSIDLSANSEYRGGLVQLVLDPPEGRFELERVALAGPGN
jgi:hypothetical protein